MSAPACDFCGGPIFDLGDGEQIEREAKERRLRTAGGGASLTGGRQ